VIARGIGTDRKMQATRVSKNGRMAGFIVSVARRGPRVKRVKVVEYIVKGDVNAWKARGTAFRKCYYLPAHVHSTDGGPKSWTKA
jgi:hypothetical protein